MTESENVSRTLPDTGSIDLAQTCAPVVWGRGRWPNTDWIDGKLIWVGWEESQVVFRIVTQAPFRGSIRVEGSANQAGDSQWSNNVLGFGQSQPAFADPLIDALAQMYSGLRPHASGALFEGLIDSIVGQSITVAAAAVVGSRLSKLFHPGIELSGRRFWPAPRAGDIAVADLASVRATGVTWKRAEAIVHAAQVACAGDFLSDDVAREDPDLARSWLRSLPLVGPWTAESALLWGLGIPDAFPTGDVALLRAARKVYEKPEMTMKELDILSANWGDARGWASRLLWTSLLGVAPAPSPRPT